ncbi:hypothetical protein Droror1_Dr00012967 [Drosera rotundifolia]
MPPAGGTPSFLRSYSGDPRVLHQSSPANSSVLHRDTPNVKYSGDYPYSKQVKGKCQACLRGVVIRGFIMEFSEEVSV